MQTKKSKLQQLREGLLADIKTILNKHAGDEMDITFCGSTPVIWPSADDQDFDTYTLDRVYSHGVNILVDSSSSDNNRTDNAINLATDTLVEILEFLEDNEDSIWEKDENDAEGFVFTVNKEGKKVKFASGNLFWDGEKFRFEKHQYDYPTEYRPDHVGHFFWSGNAATACAKEYGDKERKATDTFFATDGGAVQGWTVLSRNEWEYLFKYALGRKSVRIDGKNCIVLKPDGFSGTVADEYTAEEWVAAEASGLVALPFAGYRCGTSFSSAESLGNYWSLASYGSNNAWYADFSASNASTGSSYRYGGYSVRLVSVQ